MTIDEEIAKYKEMGAEIEEFSLDIANYALATYYIIACAEASSNLGRYDGIRYTYRAPEAKTLKEIYKKSRSEAFVKNVTELIDMACAPAWMTIDKEALKITFDRIPEREELDPEFKEQLVIEYYSK